MKILKCTVNGKPVQVGYDPRESLLDTLRNRLGLTSVKRGCEEFAVQCGFCIPGIIMSAMEMIDSGKTFTRDEIRKNLSGHLCRCTGYQNVINGVEKAIEIVHEKVGE